MSEITKINCDYCDKDLTESSNCIDWSLRLVNRRIPSREGPVTAMMIHPTFSRDLDFCGRGCFLKWFEKYKESIDAYFSL
jgi:hypothetical protein